MTAIDARTASNPHGSPPDNATTRSSDGTLQASGRSAGTPLPPSPGQSGNEPDEVPAGPHGSPNPHGSPPDNATDLTASADTVLLAATGENFSVAPVVLRAATRRHLEALYSFARLVDDIGDNAAGDRLALLDALAGDLDRVWSGTPVYPVLQALVPTVRACELEPEPFHRLVEANRQDQVVARYDTFDDLLHYCTLSADPVGRMVLGVFGLATPERVVLSDRVCTALQLAEHCQDVAEDLGRGRIYLPLEDMDAFGVSEADLAQPTASPAVRNLMAFEVGRAHTILDQGAPLVALLGGRLRLAIAGFVGGGRAALDAIRRANYDVLPGPPKAPKGRVVRFAASAALRSYRPSARRAAHATARPAPPSAVTGSVPSAEAAQ